MKKNYKMKKTLSIKQFNTEFSDCLTDHMKKRILDLWPRCVLTREKDKDILDLKHVEHTKHDCTKGKSKAKKEYAYGQFVINDGKLYFSNKCIEDETTMKTSMVDTIFDSLSNEDMYHGEENDLTAKRVDDSNIDDVIDNIMRACPPISKRHLEIISKYCDVDDFNNEVVPF